MLSLSPLARLFQEILHHYNLLFVVSTNFVVAYSACGVWLGNRLLATKGKEGRIGRIGVHHADGFPGAPLGSQTPSSLEESFMPP